MYTNSETEICLKEMKLIGFREYFELNIVPIYCYTIDKQVPYLFVMLMTNKFPSYSFFVRHIFDKKIPILLRLRLNFEHTSIKFTMELVNKNQIRFLDILVKRVGEHLDHTVYRKLTHTDWYLHKLFNIFFFVRHIIGQHISFLLAIVVPGNLIHKCSLN